MAVTQLLRPGFVWSRLEAAVLNPVRAFKLRYLPLLMVYFAYGALGLITVAESFWVKKALTLSPAELAALSVWITLPWTVKMVFGEMVDSIPIFGSQRRAYVFIGASFIAAGMLLLAGAAGGWLTFLSLENLYRLGAIVSVIGVVIQDVVADAMSTEVVDRVNADGSPRPKEEVDRELGMVQVLGRLALSLGMFVVAGIAGWIASIYSYETVFLLGLIVPLVSASGAILISLAPVERRSIDWRILGGGLLFGAFVLALAGADVPFSQEIVFVVSMLVICTMLWRVIRQLDAETQRTIFFAALIIFVYRAMPLAGQGYTWFVIDVLGFDEAFQGTLNQIGAGLALLGMWLFSDAITRRPVAQVLLWLTLITSILSLPAFGLTLGLADWTERMFGFGARTIAIIDTATTSPFAQLSMIPLLTLIAIYAPAGHRATWFALMASLMNLALVAGQLQTKYLNEVFVVSRGYYDNLPYIVGISIVMGLVLPLLTIWACGGKLQQRR
jgi:MFS family permease